MRWLSKNTEKVSNTVDAKIIAQGEKLWSKAGKNDHGAYVILPVGFEEMLKEEDAARNRRR